MDRFLYCFLNSRKRFNILQKCSLTLGRNKFKRSKLCQFQIYCRLKRNKIKHQIIVIPFNHLIRQKQIIVKITEILRKNKKKRIEKKNRSIPLKKREKKTAESEKRSSPQRNVSKITIDNCVYTQKNRFISARMFLETSERTSERKREREDNSRRLRLGPVTRKILLETSHWDPIKGSSEFEKENQPTR